MNYPGGKNQEGVAQWIINQLPPHERYIEVFAGSAAVLRMKRPAAATIAVEIDAGQCRLLASQLKALPAVIVENCDAISYLRKRRWGPETLIYLDPPYLLSTRRSKQAIYKHEFSTAAEHADLLEVLIKLNCMVALSGYRSSLYDAMLPAWRRSERAVTLRNGIKATECLWMNYPEPVVLHDYRYLGNTFRERERIKRICHNWKLRWLRMPALERGAISSMLADNCDEGL